MSHPIHFIVRQGIERCNRSNAQACEDMLQRVIRSCEAIRQSRELIAKVDAQLAMRWGAPEHLT